MKCTIPEISWHNREPVLSVDAFPVNCGDFYRVATGGSDTYICIWQLKIIESGAVTIDILSELTRHQKAVNVVRWSPNGDYLASGDDDANIIIWQLKTDNIPSLEGDCESKETWIVHKILRGHKEDVYDIAWSPNGGKLLSGSVDNTAILWDLNKGKNEIILTDHKGFVQGVSWDPKNEFIATLSSDRVCRIFNPSGKQVRARISRGFLPVNEEHDLHNKDVKYFHDDTFKTFFRRLNFSPDGNLLIVPSGSVETEECKNAMYATYIFTVDSIKQPAVILPTPKQCSIVVRCSPVLYKLRPNVKPYIDLPYRMVIAVATDNDVILYDTQQLSPFAQMHNIHYTRLTDLTWSHDGLLLTASSTDGFITLVTFEENELGVVYKKEESEEEVEKPIAVEEPEKKVVETVEEKVKLKRTSFIEQWAKQAPATTQKRKAEEEPAIEVKKLKSKEDSEGNEVITISDSPVKNTNLPEMLEKTPNRKKRITPITLKSVTPKKIIRKDSQNENNKLEKGEEAIQKVESSKEGDIKLISKEIQMDEKGSKIKKVDIEKPSNQNVATNKNQLNQNMNSPKPPKRAQLITLRLGSENGESKNTTLENEMKCKTSFLNQLNINKIENSNLGSSSLQTSSEKNDCSKDQPTSTSEVKPKKRATLIKIGECSKRQQRTASADEKFLTKLIALDKTETDEVKSSDDEIEEKSSSDESDEEMNSEDDEKNHEKSVCDKITSAEIKKERKSEKVENKEKPVENPQQIEKSDKSVNAEVKCKRISVDIENTKPMENIDSKEKTNTKNTELKIVSNISQLKENEDILDCEKDENLELKSKNVDTNKLNPQILSEDEKQNSKSTLPKPDVKSQSKEQKTNDVVEISDDEGDKNQTSDKKMKSPFPFKKGTPKQTPKRTPKNEDKPSAGKNKKKHSITPKMSLLNFFKPITSSEKAKSNEAEEGKMKPTNLFKENSIGTKETEGKEKIAASKDDVVVIDDDDDNETNLIKVKTTSLFKKSKKKEVSGEEFMEGVKKIVSPKQVSKSKTEQPRKAIEVEEEETVPEDFVLQIEDSNDEEENTKLNRVESEKNRLEDDKSKGVSKAENKTEKEDKINEFENVKENKVVGSDSKENEVKLEKTKLPRRVPLITLASPKSKKKAVDT